MYLIGIVIGSALLTSLVFKGLTIFDQSLCQHHFYRLSFVQLTKGLTQDEQEKSQVRNRRYCQSTKEEFRSQFNRHEFKSLGQTNSLELTFQKKWMNQDW